MLNFGNMKKWIPNILTLGNASCGFLALFYIFHESDIETACWLILIGALFDVFDGLLARLLKVAGPLGKQLDSLADAISFGAAPAAICWYLLNDAHASTAVPLWQNLVFPVFIVAMSVLRLARFNIDERQVSGFYGLPTPANALFWLGAAMIHHNTELPVYLVDWTNDRVVLMVFALLFGVLLNLDLPLIGLKFQQWGWKGNQHRYILIGSALAILITSLLIYGNVFLVFPVVLLLYLIISIAHFFANRHEIQR